MREPGPIRRRRVHAVRHGAWIGVVLALVLAGCSDEDPSAPAGGPSIVVTYSILGSLVSDLVGDSARVTVLLPNGADPHEWEPSARDIETMTNADLLVENGLGLEGGMTDALMQAEHAGVQRFVAADYILVRHVGAGEGVDPSDPDQAVGAEDPHLWMDPLAMKEVVAALADQLNAELGIDVTDRATILEDRLTALDDEVAEILAVVPPDDRKLVTGHESLGYFADRYGFTLLGAIIPSLTTQAETSSAQLAALEATILETGVKAIFTELGSDPSVAEAVGTDTGARVVEIAMHVLPADGSYFTFMTDIADLVADNLK
jgi:zinc/manganese transport system substrate-binding protein